MGNNSTSNQRIAIQSFTRDATCDGIPSFLGTAPRTIQTIEQASPPFLSLVAFVKEGNNLDKNATKQACTLLDRLIQIFVGPYTTDRILLELVPTPDHSCSGFTESIITLLNSSNEMLIKSTLSLLTEIVSIVPPPTRFDILNTGFFELLPKSFYEQELHLLAQHSLSMIKISQTFAICADPDISQKICRKRFLQMACFRQTFMDKFFHPIQPYLAFICQNRRRISDSEDSYAFSKLFGTIFTFSPFLRKMTRIVLSSSAALAFCDTLVFFETNKIRKTLLRSLVDGLRRWPKDDSAAQKRGQQILVKLNEEGLADDVELNFRCFGWNDKEHRVVFIGVRLMHMLGGNALLLGE
ncbi:hypothetical protein BLNAU_8691 [Blattamonas nauphoetae]|uniref:Uncharacterized protein n=1 Tax=Blattamonas nauphoetae TaxID=2049346 RepID=A0ABQ9XXX5_9EUKA|nr:hypothetical protein BLNAU_8691 [Blattamonas nauphoetae]